MSVKIVSDGTIDLIVSAVTTSAKWIDEGKIKLMELPEWRCSHGAAPWIGVEADLKIETGDDLGAALVAQNYRAFNHLYHEARKPHPYKYTPPPAEHCHAVAIIRACLCWQYNAEECPFAKLSIGAWVTEQVILGQLQHLPGINQLSWGGYENPNRKETP